MVQQFFGDWRLDYKFDHGPFWNLYSYATAFVDCARKEATGSRQLTRAQINALEDEIENTEGTNLPRWKLKTIGSKLREETEDQRSARLKKLEGLKERKKKLAQSVGSGELDKFIDWSCTRYRVADIYGHPMDDISEAFRICSMLEDLVRSFCPREDFPPNSTTIFHWDISGNNVILDDSKIPIALLDWEQLCTVPIFMQNLYPDLLWSNKGRMCRAFLNRLKFLEPPWLERFGNRYNVLHSLVETIEIGMYVGLSEEVGVFEPILSHFEEWRYLQRLWS